MVDITKCINHHCKRKEECYRYKAPSNKYWQPFAFFKEKNCKYFIPISKKYFNNKKNKN